jgi:16S rRNA (cytosine967-C5)-methyltransferase
VNGGVTPTRRAALEALRRVREGALADRVADEEFRGLPPRERAWTLELFYGTLRLRGRLDFILAGRVRGGLDALEPDVLDVLRLGAYQLLEMGSVPSYAAVSQSQELVRTAGAGRAAKLVAGVLHALSRRPATEFPDPEAEPARYLETWGSHPGWLVERWIGRWGAREAAALVEANNRRPELYIRPLGVPIEIAAERLLANGIEVERVPFAGTSLRVLSPVPIPAILETVPAVVQDPAAALVVEYAAPPAGARVVDLCAAPGGKALGLAEAASFVAAADLSKRRLERVRENVVRAKLQGRVACVVAEGRTPPFASGSVELVLLDAPCAGTGTLRRHPDGRWRVRPEHLESLTELQRELLDAAAYVVAPGGVLVYSTCSLEEEENELQIDAFLRRHGHWTITPAPAAIPDEVLDARGFLRVLPQRHGVDGSFAARLRKGE